MKAFSVTGVQQDDFEPQLVTSKEVTKDSNLLNVIFEINPLGKTGLQLITSGIIFDVLT